MEQYQQRLHRFENGPPFEFAETLLNSLHSYFIVTELRIAVENKQSNLLILGIHAVIATITEKIFGRAGVDGFRFYLEHFVDGKKENLRFSSIAESLYNLRNIVAHQWLGKLGHKVGYEYSASLGYWRAHETLFINPRMYFEQFQSAFFHEGKTRHSIWEYRDLVTVEELTKARQAFLRRFSSNVKKVFGKTQRGT